MKGFLENLHLADGNMTPLKHTIDFLVTSAFKLMSMNVTELMWWDLYTARGRGEIPLLYNL